MKTKLHNLLEGLVTKSNLLLLVCVQNALSIFFVFSSPLPIPPKTSIGLLTGCSLGIIFFLIIFQVRNRHKAPWEPHLVDWLVLAFFVANAFSLITSQHIYDITNFRLLFSAVIQYATIRLVKFSKQDIVRIIHSIGLTVFIIAFISLIQIFFRDQAMIVAKRFLFGDAAFGVAQDLERGRGVPWGSIIFSFPFFITSVFFLQKSNTLKSKIYLWLGMLLIPLAFVTSNFRWMTTCFFIGTFIYAWALLRKKIIVQKQLIKIVVLLSVVILIGVTLASAVFQYNLVDRFLFKDKERDVAFSFSRYYLYQQATTAFASSPLFGIGLGNYRFVIERQFRVYYFNYINGETGVKETERGAVFPHNDVLMIIAETGVLGITTYLLLNYFVIKSLIISFRKTFFAKQKEALMVQLTLLTSLIIYYLFGLFENMVPNNVVYLFFLYAASITWQENTHKTMIQVAK